MKFHAADFRKHTLEHRESARARARRAGVFRVRVCVCVDTRVNIRHRPIRAAVIQTSPACARAELINFFNFTALVRFRRGHRRRLVTVWSYYSSGRGLLHLRWVSRRWICMVDLWRCDRHFDGISRAVYRRFARLPHSVTFIAVSIRGPSLRHAIVLRCGAVRLVI